MFLSLHPIFYMKISAEDFPFFLFLNKANPTHATQLEPLAMFYHHHCLLPVDFILGTGLVAEITVSVQPHLILNFPPSLNNI